MRGNELRPSISWGTRPFQGLRSISAACADRERLARHRMVSFSYCRTYPNTVRLDGRMKRSDPRPNALLDLRTPIRRFVQLRSDDGLRVWASTFTAWWP